MTEHSKINCGSQPVGYETLFHVYLHAVVT